MRVVGRGRRLIHASSLAQMILTFSRIAKK